MAGTLDTLTFDTRTQTWEIDLGKPGEQAVKMHMVQEPQTEYLSGLSGDWEEADLLVWLEGRVVQSDVRHEVMIAWIAQAIAPLKHKGYSLGQLVLGRFIIAHRLLTLLDEVKAKRGNQAHRRLFELEEVVVDPAVVFRFADMAYPMRSLKDGRIFVIEYKGEDRYDHPKNVAKRAVGELWARKSSTGLYLMPRDRDEAGRDIDQQIAHAITRL